MFKLYFQIFEKKTHTQMYEDLHFNLSNRMYKAIYFLKAFHISKILNTQKLFEKFVDLDSL